MKKGVIYRIIFGKGNDGDFTADSLPKTRVKQFGFVFRRRFGVIFRVNLLAALFALPLIVWDFLSSAYISEFTAGMDVQTEFSHLLRLSLIRFGTDVPLVMLAFVGLAGAFYVIRRLCWCAPVDLLKDFKNGIKNSYKQFTALGLLTGLFVFASNYLLRVCLLTISSDTEFVYIMGIVAIALADVICFTALVYAMGQASLYNMGFFTLIKSAFILTFKRLFRSAGTVLLSVLPIAVFMFMPWVFMQIIGNCLTIVFGIGFAVTMQTVLCLGTFDVFINKSSYPDFVGLGLSTGKSYLRATGLVDDAEDSEESEGSGGADGADSAEKNAASVAEGAPAEPTEPVTDAKEDER